MDIVCCLYHLAYGRCWRDPVPKNGRIGKVYVYLPSGVKPYDKKEVEEEVSSLKRCQQVKRS